jgi:cobalt/nickel transport system permease protein
MPRSATRPFDPRCRLAAAVAVSAAIALAAQWASLSVAALTAMVAVGATAVAGAVPWSTYLRRIVSINALLLAVVVLLPLTTPGQCVSRLGPLAVSREGILLAAKIVVKTNLIALWVTALVGGMDSATLGHTLKHLRVPEKLVHLVLMCGRYLDTLSREYRRLRASMAVRGFRPGVNRRTYRAYGHLVGMLLVRSLDRSERVLRAMRCRGFRGQFHLLDHFHFAPRDAVFAAAVACLLAALAGLEWR